MQPQAQVSLSSFMPAPHSAVSSLFWLINYPVLPPMQHVSLCWISLLGKSNPFYSTFTWMFLSLCYPFPDYEVLSRKVINFFLMEKRREFQVLVAHAELSTGRPGWWPGAIMSPSGGVTGPGRVWDLPVCPRELWLPLDTGWLQKPTIQRSRKPQCIGRANMFSFISPARWEKGKRFQARLGSDH